MNYLFTRNAYLCTGGILELFCTSSTPLVVNSMFIKEFSLQIDFGRFQGAFLSTDMLLRCECKVQVTLIFIQLH